MSTVILQDLSKTYPGGTQALKRLSLCLNSGEVFGFLGPNGAGKTTTVKLLTGILAPSGGSWPHPGRGPPYPAEKVHALCGIVTEHAQMYDHLTGMENLLFYACAFGWRGRRERPGENACSGNWPSPAPKDRKLAAYSTGMRQRLSLARALLHRPQVLFLDEPTSGLDPESAQNVNHMIRNLAREEGVTVFLCTHQLRYAQEICTRFGLMEQGSLLACGTLEELRAQTFSAQTLRICASSLPENLPFQRLGPQEYQAKIGAREEIPALVRKIVEAGADVYGVSLAEPTLEDIYFSLTAAAKEGSAL